MTLKGKVALITGASRGIGAAVAKRFAQEGAHVILVARSKRALERVDDAIQKIGSPATLVAMDLSLPSNIDELAQKLFERFGRIDILVGNAGILGTLTPVHQTSEKNWTEVLNINLTTNWHLLRTMDPLLRRSEHPRAMFLTSGITLNATPFWGAYAISKIALEHLVQIYAAENSETNIRANLINPGVVGTDMLKRVFPGQKMENYTQPDEITDVFVKLAQDDLKESGLIFKA